MRFSLSNPRFAAVARFASGGVRTGAVACGGGRTAEGYPQVRQGGDCRVVAVSSYANFVGAGGKKEQQGGYQICQFTLGHLFK